MTNDGANMAPTLLRVLVVLLLSSPLRAVAADWLVRPPATPATVVATEGGCRLRLSNGLLARTFSLPNKAAAGCAAPNWATVDVEDTTDPDMPAKSVLAARECCNSARVRSQRCLSLRVLPSACVLRRFVRSCVRSQWTSKRRSSWTACGMMSGVTTTPARSGSGRCRT